MDKWETTSSETMLDSRWVKVRKDSVDLPNGQHIDDFYAITINDASTIVAIDDAGNIILKKEYRYCFDRELIEIPAGDFEKKRGCLSCRKARAAGRNRLCFRRLAVYRCNGRKFCKADQYDAHLLCQPLPQSRRTTSGPDRRTGRPCCTAAAGC